MTPAKTHAERAAAVTALSRIAHPQSVAAVPEALARLPPDENPARVSVYARVAIRLDGPGAERVLLTRLERSIQARQPLAAEIESLGRMRSKASLSLLFAVADKPTLAPRTARARPWHWAAWATIGLCPGWLRDDQLKEVAGSAGNPRFGAGDPRSAATAQVGVSLALQVAHRSADDPRPAIDAPAKTRAAVVVSAVAALVGDAYVDADVRQEAFAVARLLRGEQYAKLLADVADQAELEGTPPLAAAEEEMRRQRGLDK